MFEIKCSNGTQTFLIIYSLGVEISIPRGENIAGYL
jgi:hypothetical protein